ncbi:dioxygenase, partial [Bacillus cereus group sp. Bce025]
MMPSLFLAHGSPMLAIQDTEYTSFLKTLGETYKPKAIVIFTAHWESEVLTISSGYIQERTKFRLRGCYPLRRTFP